MKSIFIFLVMNAAIVGIQGIAALAVLGFGQLVILAGAAEIWPAWAATGILAAGGAISVAARLTRGLA